LRGLRILLRKLELGFFIVGGSIMGGMCVRAVSRQGSRERDAVQGEQGSQLQRRGSQLRTRQSQREDKTIVSYLISERRDR